MSSRFCDELIARNYGLNIWAYARVDTVKPHMLEKLRKAGIRWLALGIESGSEHVRDGAEKSFSQAEIIEVVRQIQAAGISVIGNFIFGLPDDDERTMRRDARSGSGAQLRILQFLFGHGLSGIAALRHGDREWLGVAGALERLLAA